MNTEIETKVKVAAAYIRESTEAQDQGYSPTTQLKAIEKYAKEHNIKLPKANYYKDLLSGTNAYNRTDFQRMIEDAQHKKFNVILVYHSSRFARSKDEAPYIKAQLRKKYNVDVLSVTQHFGNHWEDPDYYVNEGVNELFDGYYSRQLSFWVRSNLREKRNQGRQNGLPPFGYYKEQIGHDEEKNRKIYDPKWKVHPVESKLLVKIFRMYASGRYSFADLAHELNRQGLLTKNQNAFTHSSIKDIIHNRIYLGVIPENKRGAPEIQGVHPAIISEDIFAKCQEIMALRRNKIGRPFAKQREYLLKGLVFCYGCKDKIKYAKRGNILFPSMYCQTNQWKGAGGVHNETYTYHCKFRKESKSCSQKIVRAHILDSQINQLMDLLVFPDEIIEAVLDKIKVQLREEKELPRMEYQMDSLQKQKEKITYVFTNTDAMSQEEYLEQLNQINGELKSLQKLGISGNTRSREKEYIELAETFLRDFKVVWFRNLSIDEKRAWMQMLIKRIWIEDQKIVAIEPHEDFRPFFISLMKFFGQGPSVTPAKRIS